MKKVLVFFSAFAILLLAGCETLPVSEELQNPVPEDTIAKGGQENEDPSGQEDNPSMQVYHPAVPIRLSVSDKTVLTASNQFGLNVFGQLLSLNEGAGNVAFSPLSLSLALAMAAEGAAGETYNQFSAVLGWGDATREEVGSFYKTMLSGLIEADPHVSFSSSNSLWAALDLNLKEQYRTQLAESFNAESFSVDFTLPKTLSQINDWCSDKTGGKIPKMLYDLDPATRLMLINALLFKAPWTIEWDVEEGRDFQGVQAVVKKDYLYADNMQRYRAFEGYSAAGVQYGNGAYELILILPDEGKSVEDILDNLDVDALKSMQVTPMELYLPKFSEEYSTEDKLPKSLNALGLKLPFINAADFSGISSEQLSVNAIMQRTAIDVTEKGTEFAAVTMAVMATSAGPGQEEPEKVVFDLNRPFAYIIRETSTNAILLMGTLFQ